MKDVGKRLNLKEHLVKGRDGVPKLIIGPIDIEVHHGVDGNYYIIDYQRLMPPETPNG